MECYERARKKEALLDDPAAAAYQLSKDEQTFNGRPVIELDEQIEK